MTCECTECMMLDTFKKQTQMIKKLKEAIEMQANAILNLQNKLLIMEMAMRGMDYDEEECECGCGG